MTARALRLDFAREESPMPAPKLRQILAAGEFVVAPGVFEERPVSILQFLDRVG